MWFLLVSAGISLRLASESSLFSSMLLLRRVLVLQTITIIKMTETAAIIGPMKSHGLASRSCSGCGTY